MFTDRNSLSRRHNPMALSARRTFICFNTS